MSTKTTTRELPLMQTRAAVKPNTWDEKARTIEVTFASEAAVRRFDWEEWEEIDEILEVSDTAMDMSRAAKGLQVFKDHRTTLDNVIGRTESVWIEKGLAYARIRFSENPAHEALINDIRSGIIDAVSVGYRVLEYQRMPKKENQKRAEVRATRWTPMEISFVGVPADANASSRSAEPQTETYSVQIKEDEPMSQNITPPASSLGEGEKTLPPAPNLDGDAVRKAVEAEKQRYLEIRNIGRRAGLDDAWIDEQVASQATIDQVRAAAFERLAAKEVKVKPTANANGGDDRQRSGRREAMTNALVLRSGQIAGYDDRLEKQNPEMRRMAEQYRHYSLKDLARECLENEGVNTRGMHPFEMVGRAFTSSTSDFPIILEGTNRRILLDNYNIQTDKWRELAIIGSVGDFREYKRLRLGSLTRLDALGEGQEYQNKKLTDAEFEKIKVGTYGNIINVSREMIINDDLNAFAQLSAMLGRAARRSIEIDFFKLVESNPTMQDGNALFSTAHGNLAGTGAAPSITEFDKIRTAMAKIKDKDGNDLLDIEPHTCLCPKELGSAIRVINQSQYDIEVSSKTSFYPNRVVGIFKNIVDTARLADPKAYYLFADKNIVPTFEVAFLNGVQEPFMASEQGFTMDGTKWKIRLDYGIAAIDWRGAYKQPGQ